MNFFRFTQQYLNIPLLLTALISFSSHADDELNCSKALNQRVSIKNNYLSADQFTKNRTLLEYSRLLSFENEESLFQKIRQLPKGSVIFDMGAGYGHALIESLDVNPKIQAVAVAYRMPYAQAYYDHYARRLTYLHGDYVENMATDHKLDPWMGKVDLMTDISGPFSYSQHIDALLQIYFDLLKKDGVIYLNFVHARNYDDLHRVYDEDFKVNQFWLGDREVSLKEWLEMIPGIEVSEVTEVINTGYYSGKKLVEKTFSLKIRKLANDVRISQTLETVSYESAAPARRVFRIKPLLWMFGF